jgi:hypothetical protein
MAKKKSPRSELEDLSQSAPFEIESLNAEALDIEELETRLEMAISIYDLSLYCGADCGSNCVGNCGTNCVANCTSLCGSDVCSTDCGVNCGTDCGSLCNLDGPDIKDA